MYPANRAPIKLDPIYQPFTETDQALPLHDAAGLPPFLTVAEPEPEENPALTLKRLDLDALPGSKEGRLEFKLSDEARKLLSDYSAASGDKCRRCNNTGITGYRNHGTVIKVCRCVRKGALATEMGKAVAA